MAKLFKITLYFNNVLRFRIKKNTPVFCIFQQSSKILQFQCFGKGEKGRGRLALVYMVYSFMEFPKNVGTSNEKK